MEIRKRFYRNIVVFYVAGNFDINAAIFIEETGRLAREGINKILCDFTNVNIIDYNGLSILSIAYKNVVNQKGILKFCNVPKHILELFKTTRLDKVLDVYRNEEEALSSFNVSTKLDKLSLRRRFKRVDVSLGIKFKKGLSSESKMMAGKILNLSGSGAFIFTKNTFPLSTKLYLEITLSKNRPVTLGGVVVWLADRELQPHAYPGMGVEFTDLSGTRQEEIIEYIDRNLTRRSRI